ncbi:MAG TPA: alpha-glucosidase [Candidatus Ventrimonas merdavium]|nr:alpha-glucosidase [Candidatus Ventrimonas merdavium]
MKKQWWHDTIGYQIFPRSFQDTDHDGNGDLPGVIAHLDDLADLGINTLWLCPFNCSPMWDSGYDAADYEQVDPMFGSLDDAKRLIAEARKRGIRILMDLVLNHTSSEHAWFQEALKDPEGLYGNYYIIREGREGLPPNRWRSFFGGSAWERIGDSNRYYLHIFTKYQPDLNWENPKVRQELYGMINRWLDFGIAGFRLDSINHLKKDFGDAADKGDPFSYCTNVSGIGDMLQELKDRTYGPRGAFTIGEVNGIHPEQLEAYIGENGYFSTMFDFTFTRYRIRDPQWAGRRREMIRACREACFQSQRTAYGRALFCNVMENHDTPRVGERFFLPDQIGFFSLSMIGCLNLFLGGIPFLYQGQAIGMRDYPKAALEEFRDFTTYNLYRDYLQEGMTGAEALARINRDSREHARTPMQWNAEANGGFSDKKPWFSVNPNYREINLEAQKQDPASLYTFYKAMIAVRKREDCRDVFLYGKTVPMYEETDEVIAFERVLDGKRAAVLCNLSGQECFLERERCEEPERRVRELLLDNYGAPAFRNPGSSSTPRSLAEGIRLRPFQALVLLCD